MATTRWQSVVMGGAAFALGGCVSLDQALQVASLVNGGTTTSSTTTSYTQPQETPPPAQPAQPAQAQTASYGQWATPEYLGGMFSLAFSNMGFIYGGTTLKPGEYVRLASQSKETSEHQPGWFERAYLKDDANGQQWWRVRFEGEQKDSITIEGLYSPTQRRLVRMRAKLPNETAVREIPCENTQPLQQPQTTSPTAYGAQDLGTESITVPAGTFKTHKYKLSHGNDGMIWWLNDSIPGGFIKASGQEGNALTLQAYGTNATTELGSF